MCICMYVRTYVCMYVCMHVWIYLLSYTKHCVSYVMLVIHLHTYMHAWHTCISTCIHPCMHPTVHLHTCIHADMHEHMLTCFLLLACLLTYLLTYLLTFLYLHAYAYVHKRIHIHVHVHFDSTVTSTPSTGTYRYTCIMYVCMYVYIYIDSLSNICVCMYVCMYVCIYIYTSVHTHKDIMAVSGTVAPYVGSVYLEFGDLVSNLLVFDTRASIPRTVLWLFSRKEEHHCASQSTWRQACFGDQSAHWVLDQNFTSYRRVDRACSLVLGCSWSKTACRWLTVLATRPLSRLSTRRSRDGRHCVWDRAVRQHISSSDTRPSRLLAGRSTCQLMLHAASINWDGPPVVAQHTAPCCDGTVATMVVRGETAWKKWRTKDAPAGSECKLRKLLRSGVVLVQASGSRSIVTRSTKGTMQTSIPQFWNAQCNWIPWRPALGSKNSIGSYLCRKFRSPDSSVTRKHPKTEEPSPQALDK